MHADPLIPSEKGRHKARGVFRCSPRSNAVRNTFLKGTQGSVRDDENDERGGSPLSLFLILSARRLGLPTMDCNIIPRVLDGDRRWRGSGTATTRGLRKARWVGSEFGSRNGISNAAESEAGRKGRYCGCLPSVESFPRYPLYRRNTK